MESEALKEFEKGLRALYIQIPEGIADDLWQKWKAAKKDIDLVEESALEAVNLIEARFAKLEKAYNELEASVKKRPSLSDIINPKLSFKNNNPDKFK